MLKTKITQKIKNTFVIGIACLTAVAVMFSSFHAKDLFVNDKLHTGSKAEYSDISAKIISDLHNHIDKKIVKTFDKAATDGYIVASRSRGEADATQEPDPGLWARFSDKLLLVRIFFSLPISRYLS